LVFSGGSLIVVRCVLEQRLEKNAKLPQRRQKPEKQALISPTDLRTTPIIAKKPKVCVFCAILCGSRQKGWWHGG